MQKVQKIIDSSKHENVRIFLEIAKLSRKEISVNHSLFIFCFEADLLYGLPKKSEAEKQKALSILNAFRIRRDVFNVLSSHAEKAKKYKDTESFEILKKALHLEKSLFNNILEIVKKENSEDLEKITEFEILSNTFKQLERRLQHLDELSYRRG